MAEVHCHLQDGQNLNFHPTWIQDEKDYKIMDMLETVMDNKLNFGNEMWDEEDEFYYNNDNTMMTKIELNDIGRLVILDDLQGGEVIKYVGN